MDLLATFDLESIRSHQTYSLFYDFKSCALDYGLYSSSGTFDTDWRPRRFSLCPFILVKEQPWLTHELSEDHKPFQGYFRTSADHRTRKSPESVSCSSNIAKRYIAGYAVCTVLSSDKNYPHSRPAVIIRRRRKNIQRFYRHLLPPSSHDFSCWALLLVNHHSSPTFSPNGDISTLCSYWVEKCITAVIQQ